jgi:hypothetical protein
MTGRWIQAELAIRADHLDQPTPVELALARLVSTERQRVEVPYVLEPLPNGKKKRRYFSKEEIARLRQREHRLARLAGHLPPPGLDADSLNLAKPLQSSWPGESPVVRQGSRTFALDGDQAVVREGDAARVYRLGALVE